MSIWSAFKEKDSNLIPFLAVLGALGAAFVALRDWLARVVLEPFGIPAGFGDLAALSLMLGGLWVILQAFKKRSQLNHPDAFNLRADQPSSLFGRQELTNELCSRLRKCNLLFFDGDSGSGKTAILSMGVAHQLSSDPFQVPIMLEIGGEDWVVDPINSLAIGIGQVWESSRLSKGPSVPPIQFNQGVGVICSGIIDSAQYLFENTGKKLVIIIDQFDDYLLDNRGNFISENGSWISPKDLETSNPFWATIAELARRETARVIIATRSDTAASFASTRFEGAETLSSHLRPIDAGQALELLNRLTELKPDRETVSHPQRGWEDLKKIIVDELDVGGAVLIQELRVQLLGLRFLPALTPKEYRKAGGKKGVAALYIAGAITSSSSGYGQVGQDVARAILARLFANDESDLTSIRPTPKFQDALLEDFPDEAMALQILHRLEKSEVVRRVPVPFKSAPLFRLFHDNLAEAIRDEVAGVSIWSQALQSGFRSFDLAKKTENYAGMFSAWLSTLDWFGVAKERLAGRLRLNQARSYFIISGSRPALWALAVFGVLLFMQFQQVRQAAASAVMALSDQKGAESRVLMASWLRGGDYRREVRNEILARLHGGYVLEESEWAVLYGTVQYDRSEASELVEQLSPLFNREKRPDNIDQEAELGYLRLLGLAGKRDELLKVFAGTMQIVQIECDGKTFQDSAFGGYMGHPAERLGRLALELEDDQIKIKAAEALSKCPRGSFSGENFELQSVVDSVSDPQWQKSRLIDELNGLRDGPDGAPVFMSTSNLFDTLHTRLADSTDPDWNFRLAQALEMLMMKKGAQLGPSLQYADTLFIDALAGSNQPQILAKIYDNWKGKITANSSSVCANSNSIINSGINLIGMASSGMLNDKIALDGNFIRKMCGERIRDPESLSIMDQADRYIYFHIGDDATRRNTVTQTVELIIKTRPKPDGNTKVTMRDLAFRSIYVRGTDKLSYEFSHFVKFIEPGEFRDSLARSLLSELRDGAVRRNYTVYVAQALGAACAAGCSRDVTTEALGVLRGLIEKDEQIEGLDGDVVAKSYLAMMNGVQSSELIEQELEQIEARFKNDRLGFLMMNRFLETYLAGLRQLGKQNRSTANDKSFGRRLLSVYFHPLADDKNRLSVFSSAEQIFGIELGNSLVRMEAWSNKKWSLDREDFDAS